MSGMRVNILLSGFSLLICLTVVRAAGDPVAILVGEGQGSGFVERNQAVSALPEALTGDQRMRLMAFLENPLKAPLAAEPSREMESATLANNLVEHLIRTEPDLAPLAELFLREVSQPEPNPIWGDYCLQFMGDLLELGPERGPGETLRTQLQAALWRATRSGKGSHPGTALISLRRSLSQPGDREKLSARALEVAQNPEQSDASRLSALQVAFALRNPGVLPIARDHLRTRASIPLRLVSLRILGEMGEADDQALLSTYLSNPLLPLRQTARTAFDLFAERLEN